jgi:hypothetical protein
MVTNILYILSIISGLVIGALYGFYKGVRRGYFEGNSLLREELEQARTIKFDIAQSLDEFLSCQMKTGADDFLRVLNQYWDCLEEKPTLDKFNIKLSVTDRIIPLEKIYPQLGYGHPPNEPAMLSISTLSLLASVTDLAYGKRLAATMVDGVVHGWQWYVSPEVAK